jgi:cell division protein FtsA
VARIITTGIDIGTSTVKVVVAELIRERGKDRAVPKIIATGVAEARGLRHGYVMSVSDAARSVAAAVRQAEKVAGIPIKRAFIAANGVGVAAMVSQGSAIVSRGDSEIVDLDVEKALQSCEKELPNSFSLNRKIIHSIPLSYRIDGKVVLGRPQGMRGMKLEARTLFVTCLEQHLSDIIQVLDEVGIEIEDVMAGPLAASLVTLTKAQKIAGCVLAVIGAETVGIAVFENSIPISLEVFPIGSTDITHDIALGLKVPLEEAEQIKKNISGTHASNQTGNQWTSPSGLSYSKKKLEEIIEARFDDMFELIEGHLKKIGRAGLLPAGIIMTGGGATSVNLEEQARAALKIPAKIARPPFDADRRGWPDSLWSTAHGLCILGLTQEDEPALGMKIATRAKSSFLAWIRQFLP